MMMADQPDIVAVKKNNKKGSRDVAIPSDTNIKERTQGAQEMPRSVTPKLGEWLQQILKLGCECSVQKSAILGTAKILRRTLRLPSLFSLVES